MDEGEEMLKSVFGSVERHDFTAELVLTDSAPLAAYIRSTVRVQLQPDRDRAVAAVEGAIPFGPDGVFRVRTYCGCLVAT